MRSFLPSFLWFACLLMAAANPTPVNIAVVDTPETADLGALVTTELSPDPRVHLLERDDLAKVGNEEKVQQLAGGDAISLGKLLGADGLIFIAKSANGVEVRFTAVGLGYALFDDEVQAGADLPAQAKAIAHRVADYASKLRLDPVKTVPLSVINLRADTDDAQTVALERPLTLLVESRLSSVPEYVVLERRHAWSLGFEHSLDPSAKPLLHGAYLIDGTISRAGPGNACTVHLRLRTPHGGPAKTVDIVGTMDDVGSLANKILAEIENDIPHASPTLTSFDTAREADEYLHEALWGWRAGVPQSALEAVDAAELLGAPEQDVLPLRINILCQLADQGMGNWSPNRGETAPVFAATALDTKVDAILRAIDDAARYRDQKLESQIQDNALVNAYGPERFSFRTGEIIFRVSTVASKLLVLLEQAQSPRADELRLRLRAATGYDPLHGRNGVTVAQNSNSADSFQDDWAQSLPEELAWYRLEFTDAENYPPREVLTDPARYFCARFLTTPEARQKGFDDFVESLKDSPKSQRMYLVLKTHNADPTVANADYRDYLNYIWPMRDRLASTDKYDSTFGDYWRIGDTVITRNAKAGFPFLHAILNAPRPGQWSSDEVRMLWRPEAMDESDAKLFWQEITGYMDRRNAVVMEKSGRSDQSFLLQMDQLKEALQRKFPAVADIPAPDETPAVAAACAPLVISQFWYPWLVPTIPVDNNCIFSATSVADDGIFIAGLLNKQERGVIFEVHLPDLSTKVIDSMDGKYIPGLLWTPQALYAPLGSDRADHGLRRQLARYDFATALWAKHDLSEPFFPQEIFTVDGTLYLGSAFGMSLSDEDCGLDRYDWDKGQETVLASSRRRPAQNQFDDAAAYRVTSVFAGPGGRPTVTTSTGTFYIQDTPGNWPAVFDGRFNDYVVHDGERTLVFNPQGEATLIDPKVSTPIPWMASDEPIYRTAKGSPGNYGPVPTPWAAQAIFDCPPGKRKQMDSSTVAFHDGHLFVFVQPDPLSNDFELLYYDPSHGRKPLHIPLQFQFTDSEKIALSLHPGHLPNGWSLDELLHPRTPFKPRLVASNQGLCFVYMLAGFWFVPYDEIDAYVKSHAADSTDSTVPPPASGHGAPSGKATGRRYRGCGRFDQLPLGEYVDAPTYLRIPSHPARHGISRNGVG
jgi:hypothetical protein